MRQGAVATLVGAGGLGGPIAHALAGSGLSLHIYDADVVEPSNLHRQVHFSRGDVGKAKAELLAARLAHPGAVPAVPWPRRWTDDEAAACDLLIEGSDDPVTKFAASDWAAQRGVPFVIAGALGLGGNVFAGVPQGACFRCLFEEPPEHAPTCAEAGVLGSVVAQIAALAAHAARQLLRGELAASALWVVEDALSEARTGRPPRRLQLERRAGCAGCGKARTT